MITSRRIILLVAFLFCFYDLSSQINVNKPFILNFTKNTYKGGNQNWSITTTKQGIVYIGNNEGLLEFDGSNWKLHKMPDGLTVRSVATNGENRIYVGSYEEFGYWKVDETNQKNYISLSDSINKEHFHNDEIWRIIPRNDTIYFQSFNSIYIYSDDKIETFSLQSTAILLSEARERLFIQKINDGIYELKNKKLNYISGSRIFAEDEVKFVIPFRKDEFLIGASEMGLYVYDGENFYPWKHENREMLTSSELNNGVLLDSLVIIGTIVDGIFIFDQRGRMKTHLNSSDFLQNNTVLTLNVDNNGNFWAGLDQGIDYINLNSPIDFYADSRKEIGSVYAAELFNSKLWVGTNQGLYQYNFLDNGELSKPELIQGTQGQIWDLFKTQEELYIGHNNCTYYLTKDNELGILSDISGGYDFEPFIYNDKKYGIQSTYSNLVLYERSGNKWTYLNLIEGFVEPVENIEVDRLGNIWGKHINKGVFKLQLNRSLDSVIRILYYNEEKGLPKTDHLNIGNINRRLVFSTGDELYVYDDLRDSIIPFTKLNDQLDHFRKSRRFIKSSSDQYWFIYENNVGLAEITDQEVTLDFSYDLSRQGFNLLAKQPNIETLKKDLHLFCLDNGFAFYQSDNSFDHQSIPKVRLRAVIMMDEKGDEHYLSLESKNTAREIPYKFRHLKFEFSSTEICYKPLYRYKLAGLNSEFSQWTDNSRAEYNRLPFGNYEFVVQNKDIHGKNSDQTAYSFEILPPWYLSKTAVIVYVILLLSGLYLLRIVFKRRLKKHAIIVEQREKEKRRREQMIVEQRYMQMKNRDLQSEIASKSIELANFTMTIIHKNEVLLRIKEELQNLKKELGPRFPNYQYKKLVKILEKNLSSEDEWKIFESHFDKAHENFFRRLKSEYPELTPNDLKLCAYLRMNLSTKEIAPLLNISIRGVEVRRYRLRKRLKLPKGENLVEFLLSF